MNIRFLPAPPPSLPFEQLYIRFLIGEGCCVLEEVNAARRKNVEGFDL